MLDVQLKEQTRQEHLQLEKKLISRISEVDTVTDYVDLLAVLYGYYGAVENVLADYFRDTPAIHFHERRKAARLLGDIAIYSPSHPTPRLCSRVPHIASFYSALGVMYVLEGSTLGGQIIAKLISRKLNVASGLNFFLSYGNDVERMWASFKDLLRKPYTSAQQTEAVAGAKQTFQTFNSWLSEHEQIKL
jgi:heme oxygenase